MLSCVLLMLLPGDGPVLLEFPQTHLEMGQIRAGEVVHGGFEFSSRSEHTLNVLFLLATCQCQLLPESQIFARVEQSTQLPALEKGHLTFSLREPKPGPFQHFLELLVTQAGWEQKIRLTFSGEVLAPVEVRPKSLHFDLGKEPERLNGELILERQPNTTIESVGCVGGEGWFVFAPAHQDRLPFRLHEEIFTMGGQKVTGVLHVQYLWEGRAVQEPISYVIEVPNPLRVEPSHVIFGRVQSPLDRIQTVELDTEKVRITGVASAPPYVSVRYGTLDNGKRTVVYLQLTQMPSEAYTLGMGFSNHVLLQTDVPGRPVRIPFAGKVMAWD